MFRKFWFLILLFGFYCEGCNSEDFPDVYTELKADCLFTDKDKPIPYFPPDPCRTSIMNKIHFAEDIDSFTEDYGDQKDYILMGLYFLYNYPTSVPQEKKVFQTASVEHFMPPDLQNWMTQYPDMPLHQILFNYVLHTTHTFRITTNPPLGSTGIKPFWQPLDQSINLPPFDISKFDTNTYGAEEKIFSTALDITTTILHEAWHSRSLNHDIHCPLESELSNECDKTMNGPHGIESSYSRAVIQGNEERLLTQTQVSSLTDKIEIGLGYIYSLPDDMESLKQLLFNQFSYSNGSISSAINPEKYLTIIRQEQLTPLSPKDWFTPFSAICSPFESQPSLDCQKAFADVEIRSTPSLANFMLYLLLKRPLALPSTVLKLDSVENFFYLNDNFYYLFSTRDKKPNRFLFDFILSSLSKNKNYPDILSGTDFSSTSSQGTLYLKVKQILLPWSVLWSNCDSNCSQPSSKQIEQSNRLAFLYLLSILHTNRLQPPTEQFLTSSEEDQFFDELCQVSQRLGKTPLSPSFQILPTLSCEELRNRF